MVCRMKALKPSATRFLCAAATLGALTVCTGDPVGTGRATGRFVGPPEAGGSDERYSVRIEGAGGIREFELRSGETYKAEGLPPMTYRVTSDTPGDICPTNIEIRENTTVSADLVWPCSG